MSRPNAAFALPPEPEDLRADWYAPTLAPIDILEGCEDDMRAIGAALLDAFHAYTQLADGSAANSKLACHMAANKLHRILNRALVARAANVHATVTSRT